ncbi:MAG: DUF3344 domain-containing protein, partial [Methanosarcinaceae archaeon]
MEWNNKITQLLVVLLVILLISTPASAMYSWNGFQLNGDASNAAWAYNGTVASGTVDGNVYIDCGHGSDYANPPDGYVQEFSVPSHNNVELARLYVGVWHGTENHQGKLKVEYTSSSGTNILSATGTDASGNLTLGGALDDNDNVWSSTHGVDWIWYDVTDLVDAGVNTATGYTYKVSSGFDGRIYGFKLVVVYEDTPEPEVMYWINQGHDALSYATSGHPERNSGTAHFDGTIVTGDWDYAMLHCTWVAGDPGDSDTLKFNGHVLDDSCTSYEQGAYLDSRWYVVDTSYLLSSGNYAEYTRDTDNYVHWMGAELVLFSEEPQPDLKIASMDDPVLVDHDSTHGYVVGHDYTINTVITNQGKASSGACQVALYEGTSLEDTINIGALGPGCSESVTFDWHSDVTGTNVALKAVADNSGQVTESDETNNERIEYVEVLAAGSPDLVMTGNELAFLPAWKSDDTMVRITVTNLGTGDANNFVVKAYNDATQIYSSPTMSVAAKGDKVIDFAYSAAYGGPYNIKAVLDTGSAVTESNEGNNEATKQLNVIEVMLWNSHHHGDTSAYNGIDMFKISKFVPEHTTPWDALASEATITPHFGHPEQTYVYGIDGIDEDMAGPIYWYLYLNGRYVPNNQLCGVIKLLDGETMHWDFQKQIYTATDSFTPPCTVQSYVAGDDLYPEPFKHGLPTDPGSGTRTVWNTVIVYPAGSSDFQDLASDIKDTLVAGGVPTGLISIAEDTSVTTSQKENCNLILIGDYDDNSLIALVNVQHEDIGMPVYFDYTSCEILEDDDDQTTSTQSYDHGAVVEAFDNPWNNGAFVEHTGTMILMASGLNDGDAKDAANMLISNTAELNEFWRVKLAMCGDVNDNGVIDMVDAIAVRNHWG